MIHVQFPLFSWKEKDETSSPRGVDLQYTAEIRDRRDLMEFVLRSGGHILQEAFPGDFSSSELYHRMLSLNEQECAQLLSFLRSIETTSAANDGSLVPLIQPEPGKAPPTAANANDQAGCPIHINYVDRIITVGERHCPVLSDDSWLYYTSVIEANGAWISTGEIVRAYNTQNPNHHRLERLNATKARENPSNPVLENLIETGHEGSRLKSEFCRAILSQR